MTKVCTKCGIEKELSDFTKDKTKKWGIKGHCKKCQNAISKRSSEKHKDTKREYSREYAKNHREMYRKWEIEHPERTRENARRRYNKNKEYLLYKHKKYRAEHPEWSARAVIKKTWGLKEPPQELIDLKAEQIQLFRAVRDKRLEEKGNEQREER